MLPQGGLVVPGGEAGGGEAERGYKAQVGHYPKLGKGVHFTLFSGHQSGSAG